MKKKRVLLLIIAVIMLIGGVICLVVSKDKKSNENSTLNALIDEKSIGVALEDINIYRRANLNSKSIYTIKANEEMSIMSTNEYTDDNGNVFIKVIYSDQNSKNYSGYVEKSKVEVKEVASEEDDNTDENNAVNESDTANEQQGADSSINNNSGENKEDDAINPIEEIVVSFNSDGGSKIVDQKIKVGDKITKPKDPTKKGYTFGGWTLNGKLYNFDLTVTTNMTLKAKWNPNEFKVTFDTDGGSKILRQKIKVGDKITKPKDPTKEGYTFGGWTLNGKVYNFNLTVTTNMTLKAKWNPKKFTVTFDTDGGTEIKDQVVYMDHKIVNPGKPRKAGNTFVAWKTLKGKVFNLSTKVTSDLTLKATYKYDFTSIDKCASTAQINAASDNFKLYRCVEDYGYDYAAHGKHKGFNYRQGQGFAVSKDYVYINYPIYGAWSQNVNNFPNMYKNFVHRIKKSDSSVTTSWIRYGGHGQSFDVVDNNGKDLLYYNAYPYRYCMVKYDSGDKKGKLYLHDPYEDCKIPLAGKKGYTIPYYGSYYRGFAYSAFKKSDFMDVVDSYAFDTDGSYKYLSAGHYNGKNIVNVVKATNIYNPDIAIDENSNTLALVSSKKAYIYNLKKLNAKAKISDALIRIVNIDINGKQGVELIANSLYVWNEGDVKGTFKLEVYNISDSKNGDTIKPYKTAVLNLATYYKNKTTAYEKKAYDLKNCEAEGMSIYNSRVYLYASCSHSAPLYARGDIYQLVWE